MRGRRTQRGALAVMVVAVCLVAGIPAHADDPVTEAPAADDPFPEYDAIRDNVDFWTRVWGEWDLGQVVVHDMDHPALIFEIVDLPGPVEEIYTDAQREFVEAAGDRWRDWLTSLEARVDAGAKLDQLETTWVAEIADKAGPGALNGVADRVRTQRGLRERFRRGLEISARYEPRLRAIFREAGLPEDLAYLPHVESSFQAAARSSAGAVGVWQFTRGTARLFMNVDAALDERLDPIAAAHGAARYLASAYERLDHDWPIALTSYNHGVGGMARAVEQFGADYPRIVAEYRGRLFGFASRNFYAEFLAARRIARDPERWFPGGLQPEPPLEHDSIVLDGRTTPSRIARAYGVPLDRLAEINPAWTHRAVQAGLALPQGHQVWLPAGTLDRTALSGRDPDYLLAGWVDDRGAYVVQPGDTLGSIAATYGTSVDELRDLNGLPSRSSLIRVGQRLRLSGAETESIHVVRPRETLSTIAQTYGMRLDELRALNGIPSHDNLIRVGQRLRVSGAPVADVYTVRRGDSLMRIAIRSGVRLADLLSANSLSEASIIHPGQTLSIPR